MISVIACVMVLMAGPTQAGELDDAIKRLGRVCGVPTFACQEACRSPADLAVPQRHGRFPSPHLKARPKSLPAVREITRSCKMIRH
jgi:hypothetical protein